MTFNPNIPAPGTKINKTFQLIQENFNQLNQLYGAATGKDHVEWNNADATNRGLHKKVKMVEQQVGDPALTYPQTQLYSKIKTAFPFSVADPGSALFFAGAVDNAGPTQFLRQLTDLPQAGSSLNTGMKTPWGVTINWGRLAAPNMNGSTFNFAVPFLGAPNGLQVSALTNTASRSVVVNSSVIPTETQFSVRTTNTGLVFYFFAIGNSRP